MALKFFIFTLIFIVGELLSNWLIFGKLRNYFSRQESNPESRRRILWLEISVFKGILERFVLFSALVMGLTQILIVFGTLKIGSRFDKKQEVLNDYFIIGNFSSLMCTFIYLLGYHQIEMAFR
jgi:hypothetical protein